jgi:translocator protein
MGLIDVLSQKSSQLAIALLIPNVGSGLSQLIFRDKQDDWFKNLKKPCYNPPGYVFAPVWAGLYTGMGYASYLAYTRGGGFNGPARIPLMMYGGQLVYNFAWYRLFVCKRSLKWVSGVRCSW